MKKPSHTQELHQEVYKYKAFISYRHSHHDTIIANYLYQMLATEKLSQYLGNQEGIPEIKRVYKDEEASSAASDLNESIRLALKQSKTFIVIISNQTFQSKWIPQEIRTFLELYGHERMMFLLTEGELPQRLPESLPGGAINDSIANSDTAEAPEENWLQGITILDIRGESLRENLKQIKRQRVRIMAKILDCPLESIEYAEVALRKKQDRGLKAVILGSLLAFLAGVFLFQFIQSNLRDQVMIQQRIAKKCFFELAGDLVDSSFRIPEVTRELKRIFAQDIQELSEKCRVLEKQKGEAARADRAAGYALLGNLYLLCGDLPRANEFHELSLETSELLKKKRLSYGQVIEATSALLTLGDLRMKLCQYDRAISDYDQAVQLTASYRNQELNPDQGLLDRIPHYFKNFLIDIHLLEYNQSAKIVDLTLNQNTLAAYQRIGEGLYSGGRISEALNVYSQCLELLKKAPGGQEKTVQSQLQLVRMYNRIGNIQSKLWNLGVALNCHLSSQTMLKDVLLKEPHHPTVIYHLMLTQEYIGDTCLIMGNLNEASAYYEESIRNAQRIMPALKRKMNTYRDIINGYASLAAVRLQTNETAKSSAIYYDIIGMEQELLQKIARLPDDDVGPKSLEIGKAYSSMAYSYLMLNHSEKAVAIAKQALKAEPLLDAALSIRVCGEIMGGNSSEAKRLLREASSWEQGRFENFTRYCLNTTRNLMQLNPGNQNLVQFQNRFIHWKDERWD